MSSRSSPVDGFRLAFDRHGPAGAPAVVLLHGWPGNRHDYRRVVPLLADAADVVVPDLRGFGGSDKHAVDVRQRSCALAAAARGRQQGALATGSAGNLVSSLPPIALADRLIDGNLDNVGEYLRHFWSHWSGPNFRLPEDDLEKLAS